MGSFSLEIPEIADGKRIFSLLFASPNLTLSRDMQMALSNGFAVQVADTGWDAQHAFEEHPFDIIVLDAELPGQSGYALLKRLQQCEHQAKILLLHYASDRDRAAGIVAQRLCHAAQELPCGEVVILRKIWGLSDRLVERDWASLSPLQAKLLRVTQANLNRLQKNAASSRALDLPMMDECCDAIIQVAENGELGTVLAELRRHHSYTFVHSLSVAALLVLFGINTGIKGRDLKLLAQGGLVHDIGKCLTPLDLLDKPSGLDEDEWVVMREHVNLSDEIIGNTTGIAEEVKQIAAEHHEKVDGTGYPKGLIGAQISDLGLIAAIVDIYSALVDKRAYKPAFTPVEAFSILDKMTDGHVEPVFLKPFKEMILVNS